MEEPAVEKPGISEEEDDSPTTPESKDPWWRTFLLWLPCFAIGYHVCYTLGTLALLRYHDIQIHQLTQLPFWQQCLPYSCGQAGGDFVWQRFRWWRGR